MELTGKCKEAFLDYLAKTNQDSIEKGIVRMHWQEYPEKYLNALIIDFFDSVNINIHIDITSSYYLYKIYVESLNYPDYEEKFHHGTNEGRKIAQTEAIKKANEIYNQNN